MNRSLFTASRNSHEYAREELRVELASAFVGGVLGIPAEPANHASYIGGWLKPLKEDKREFFRAVTDAQKIADYQLSLHPEYALKMVADQKQQAAANELRAAMPRPERAARSYKR